METPPFPEPTAPQPDLRSTLLTYLDFFRGTVVARIVDLPDDVARRSSVPTGWSPLELAYHLAFVEMRWLDWGFEGADVDDPWGDQRNGRWAVPDGFAVGDVVELLNRRGAATRAVVESHDLDERGMPGDRWDGAEPATLQRVLLHLVQEYARHCGHLDIVRELHDGRAGE